MFPFLLAAPLKSMLATEGFSSIRSADSGGTRLHGGVDLRAPVGTPAYAASGGRVIFGGQYADGSGGAVELDHGDGVVSRYLHLSRVDVKSGQQVSRGQQLGLTGYAVSPHLHWDIWASMARLPSYVSSFGTPTGGFTQTKTWPTGIYYKVPAEPTAPMSYQDDVIAAAKQYNVKLYSPMTKIVLLAAAGVAGFAAYRYLS